MATLNMHSAPPIDAPPPSATATDRTDPHRRDRAAGAPAHRRAGPAAPAWPTPLGVATVCALALVNLLAGGPAPRPRRTAEQSRVGRRRRRPRHRGHRPVDAPPMEDPELLGQLAASRARARRGAGRRRRLAGAGRAGRRGGQGRGRGAGAAEAAAAAAAAAGAPRRPPPRQPRPRPPRPPPPPPPPATAATAVAKISNSAGAVRPQAQAAADAVVSNVPGAAGITIGGTRASAADPGGHPSGLALDYMAADAGPR